MNGTRILGSVVAAILASSLCTLVACNDASHDKQETVPTSQAVSAASVQISIQDSTGKQIGTASGTMIAPQLVLTAAHNLAGQSKWTVTSADGKQVATSGRSMTYDWMTYDSDKAHPRRHDVGVIHLDSPITLAAYPKLVSTPATDNVSATRIRGINGGFAKAPVTLNKVQSSPNAWLGNAIAGESLDTGGAVYNDSGILGVISGQGMTTGKLYVARIDQVNSWLSAKVACAGGSENTDTYVAPAVDKTVSDCTDGGTASSSNGSNGSGSGAGVGNGSGPNGGPGSGGTCSNNNEGNCSGANCGTGGTNGQSGDDDDDNGSSNGGANGGSNGSNGGGNGSGPGNGGTNGTNGSPGNGGDNGGTNGTAGAGNGGGGGNGNGSGPGNGGTNGTNGSPGNGGDNGSTTGSAGAGGGGSNGSGNGSGPGNGGTNGTPGGGDNGNAGAGGSGSNGGAGGSGSNVGGAGSNPNGGDSGEVCQGSNDNSDICPVEPTDCSGPTCGGGFPDGEIDYGNCACSSSGGGDPLVVK